MLEVYRDTKYYLINDWNMSGWKVRMVARSQMFNALICELLYTWWVFSLPKNWHPDLKGQGPFNARHFRIFCFFIYNASLMVNCGQFFNGLLLYGCVDRGVKEQHGTSETCKFYIYFSLVFCVISVAKFIMLAFFLDYGLGICIIMSVPELATLVCGILIIAGFQEELGEMEPVEDRTPYYIGKNGKIIFVDGMAGGKDEFSIPSRYFAS